MSNRQINIVRATYSKVGPTSVSDSSLARTKKIQVRLNNFSTHGRTLIWGLKQSHPRNFFYNNRGSSSQVIKFSGIFPRLRRL